MPAVRVNLVGNHRIQQGSTYELQLTVYDTNGDLADLTDFTAFAQIRETHEDVIAYDFATSITGSVIDLLLTAVISETIPFENGVWDCELHHTSGKVVRIVEGTVQVTPEVTR